MAGVSLHGRNGDKSWLLHDLRKHVHSMGYGHLRWHGFSLEGINRNRFRLMNTTMRYQSKQLWGLSGTRELTIGDLGITTDVWLHCQTDMEDEPEQTARFCLQSIVLAILINNNISAVCRLVSYVNPRPSFTLDDVSLCLYYDNILQSKTHKAFARNKQHLVEDGNNDNDLTIPVYGFSCLSYTNWWSHGLSSRQSAIEQWHSRTLFCAVTDSYVLKSETDVVGAATVHILHDINAVLNDGLQNGSIKWNTSGPRATKLALTSDGPPITARASLRY